MTFNDKILNMEGSLIYDIKDSQESYEEYMRYFGNDYYKYKTTVPNAKEIKEDKYLQKKRKGVII